MNRTLNVIAMIACCVVVAACQSTTHNGSGRFNGQGQWSVYGEQPMGAGDAVSIGALSGDEKNVVIHGTIVDVCKVKGCWMTVRDEAGRELFVKFKDYGFFVPRNSTGRNMVMHGWVVKKVMSVEELQHYAHDAGKSAEEIAAITQPDTRLTFYADSVMIDGRNLDKPYQSVPGDECY